MMCTLHFYDIIKLMLVQFLFNCLILGCRLRRWPSIKQKEARMFVKLYIYYHYHYR